MASPLNYASFFLFFLLLATTAHSQTPVATFSYVNEGEFGPYITENDATYRTIPIAKAPFQLAFYNTTPNQFYLALRMGTRRSESVFRWVWQANPFHPVHENAVFALRPDGNLVLTESDGTVVFSSNTANKGVVGLELLPNGNIVLYNANKTNYLWQSFDHPVDTLLVGQSLHVNQKLVSKNGAYSFVLQPHQLALYMNKLNLKYGVVYESDTDLTAIKFQSEPTTEEAYAYELTLQPAENLGSIFIAQVKYNSTLSFLRIEDDGNLVAYTFYLPVDYRAWEKTFSWFSDAIGQVDGCELPTKCGGFGVCKDEMCVACPTRKGLVGWSEGCKSPDLGKCKAGEGVKYFRVEGVDTFLSRYEEGVGGLSVDGCKKKCSLDCKCLGFLYWGLEKKCWLAPVIGTLRSVSNSTHVAYIKYAA